MSVTELSVLPHGTRVQIVRGPYPSDPSLLGQAGTVVEHSTYFPTKVHVVLDGDPGIRTFATAELEVVAGPEAIPPDREAVRKRLVRP